MFFSDNDTEFIEEVKQFIPASTANTRTRLWPFIEQAERKYILPVLGRDLYNDLQAYYNTPDTWESGSAGDSAKSAELLTLIQLSEINLAFYLGFDLINSKISDMGFQRTETESTKGLYKYQEENVRNHFRDTGLNGIDDILELLEDYIEYFPEWEGSTAFTIRKTSYIKDTETFNTICDIANSRLIFLRLQPFIQQVSDIDIKALLGVSVYDALNEELAKEDPAEAYTNLATQIQKPLAFLSMALLVLATGTVTDKGFYFEGKNSGFPDNTTTNPAGGEGKSSLYLYYKNTGEHYLDALRQYLTDNTFTGYEAIEGSVYNRDNDDKKTFFAL